MAASFSRFTMEDSCRKKLVKPRLGMRRCSGIWPPSNPRSRREPLRERWPLWPRVEVLPMPEPMPRPTRLRFSDDFFGALMFDKFMTLSFDNRNQVRHFLYHAANRRRIRTLDDLVQPRESKTLDDQLVLHRGTDGGAHVLQMNRARLRFVCHNFRSSLGTRCRIFGTRYSSSAVLPRKLATASLFFSFF